MDTRMRSLVKVVVWRLIAVSITMSITYGITGEAKFALAIGSIDAVLKTTVHFIHERIWDKIDFGREKYNADNLDDRAMPVRQDNSGE